MNRRIFVINLGSTSSKIALYQDETCLWTENIEHPQEELAKYDSINDQFEMRRGLVMETFADKGGVVYDLAAVVSRGGPFASVRSGAYEINKEMADTARYRPLDNHVSTLGILIAWSITQESGVKSYIYDAVTVDELTPLARIVGLKEMSRQGRGHNLNMRAAALSLCDEKGWDYREKNILVAHMGGGITLSLHSNGRIVDMISDDEGAFSPERAGGLPGYQLVTRCYDGTMDKKEMMKHLQRRGGLLSLLGTTDTRKVEEMIKAGDACAELAYQAMALHVAKNLAKLSVVVKGNIDAIILTGGIANSRMFTGWIKERVSFIAPVEVIPGENEMESLALGALRVLRGSEEARVFAERANGD